MDSANLHHYQQNKHQLQQQVVNVGYSSSSSSLATPSFHGSTVESSNNNNNTWSSNLLLNDSNFNLNINRGVSSSRGLRENPDEILLLPSLSSTSMVHHHQQEFPWISNNNTTSSSFMTNNHHPQSAHEHHHLAKIKKQLSADSSGTTSSCSKYLLSNLEDQFHYLPSTTNYIKHEQQAADLSTAGDGQKLLLKSFSSADMYSNNNNHTNSQDYYATSSFGSHVADPYGGSTRRSSFSQIFPSTNISDLQNHHDHHLSGSPSSTFSSSLGMNFQALDLLSSGSFGGQSSQPSNNNSNIIGLFKDSSSASYDFDHLQSSSPWPTNNNHNKMSSLMNNGVTYKQRSSSSSSSINALENSSKASHHHRHTTAAVAPNKKPRMESRSSSFPPFKVRKEKLGDRIASLQQLVAPFGKTDTASVLMEAIGYIKFLQDQVENLSVPYMKSAVRNTTRQIIQRGSSDGEEGSSSKEVKRDLKSRGLCLVPLSFTSYIPDDSLGSVWLPLPNFGGGI